ncbi:hypothetical protein EDB80DRAFT_864185 [Ilyonectria destructans]|nr:hypothetical protein EDB80DRAFT_864185 [Ilyonectria destructans]
MAHFNAPLPEVIAPSHGSHIDSPTSSSRVCDNCILKKVICGDRHALVVSSADTLAHIHQSDADQAHVKAPTTGPGNPVSPNVEVSSTDATVSSHEPIGLPHYEPPPDARSGTGCSTYVDILPEEEEHLIGQFLEVLHDAVPIFSRARFLSSVRGSVYSRDLISTLLLITAKLTRFTFTSDRFVLDTSIDLILGSGSVEEDIYGDCPSLDHFRKACLLAFYEFNQFPGQQAWIRISKLTRTAYWIGLDRLENLHAHTLGGAVVGQDDLDDWRLVWWFIYRLDSYVNLSYGVPYLIDETLVKTALPWDQQSDDLSATQELDPKPKIYLPSRPDDLWKLVDAVTSVPRQTSLSNLHTITVTATRQAGRALQLHMLEPSTETVACSRNVERRLSALRLALPTSYLNPTRNVFLNETSSVHHSRLVTILHLHVARLLVSIIKCSGFDQEDEWLLSWQQLLEICQDIASVSEQWNSTFCLSADPAVCLIVFTALGFVDLQRKFAGVADSTLQSNLEHCETVLLLLLEKFASSWTLPRLLVLSFKSFKESLTGPLTRTDIQTILSRFEAPLHPRWLRFLSSTHGDVVN